MRKSHNGTVISSFVQFVDFSGTYLLDILNSKKTSYPTFTVYCTVTCPSHCRRKKRKICSKSKIRAPATMSLTNTVYDNSFELGNEIHNSSALRNVLFE